MINATKQETTKKCPICSSNSTYIFTSKHGRKIFECSNTVCGHFFTPIIKEAQGICDREENLEQESEASLHIFAERNARLLKLFVGFLDQTIKPVTFLDFGAGNAHISRTFKSILKDQCVIYCLEANPLCEGLYAKHDLIQIKNIHELPDKIDFVYMIEVVEHLDDPISALKVLRTTLKPNSKIFLSTPPGKRNESSTNAYDTPSHIHFFTPASLNLALKTAGFAEIHYDYYPEMYPLPPRNNIARRIACKTTQSMKSLLAKIPGTKVGIRHLVGATRPLNKLPEETVTSAQ